MKQDTVTKNLLTRIAESWSREKDNAQPRMLEWEIQHQLDCSYGVAANLANSIRLGWKPQ